MPGYDSATFNPRAGVGGGADWGNIAGMGAGVASQYLNRNGNNLNESQRARQDAIGRINDYSALISKDKAFDPTRAFMEQRRGAAMANFLKSGGYRAGEGYGAAPGARVEASQTGHFGNAAGIIAALQDPSTYSMRVDENGQYVYDPLTMNPLELAYADGKAKDGGYTLNGEDLRFGRDESEGDGNGQAYMGAASGALSGASTGASIGSVVPGIGTGIGAGVGAAAGGLIGYFQGRSNNREASVNRAENLGVLNDFIGESAAREALAPTDAFRQMIRGEGIANFAQSGGFRAGSGYGAEPGERVAASLQGHDPATAGIIEALRNPETFSMRNNGGQFEFDPVGFNMPDLAFMEGKAKDKGYSRAGDKETSYFGNGGDKKKGKGGKPSSERNREEDEREKR